MSHFFERRDPWGNPLAIWVVAVMAFLTPLGVWSVKQTRLENDVEKWLPREDPQLLSLRWAHQQFPVNERVFVTWEGASLNDPRIARFIERIEGQPDKEGIRRGGVLHVDQVIEPGEVLQLMQRNRVEPAEAARRLTGVILGHGPLRVRLSTEGQRETAYRVRQLIDSNLRSVLNVPLEITDGQTDLASANGIPLVESAADDAEAPAEEVASDAANGATAAKRWPRRQIGPEVALAPPPVLAVSGDLLEAGDVTHDLCLSWRGLAVGTVQAQQVADRLSKITLENGQPLIQSAFFVPGSPVALACALSDTGIEDKAGTVAALRQIAAEVGIPRDQLRLGGSIVGANELNSEVVKAAWDKQHTLREPHRKSVMLSSLVVGMVLAFVMLRNLRLSILVLAVSIYATFLSLAIVPVTGGSMNMVLVVLPSLLLVLTLSGAIHVANYWKHAACKLPMLAAVVSSSRSAALPCFLASLTTAIGLASLCTSTLTPVRDFGIYGAVGTMLSLVLVLYGLPAMFLLWPGKAPEEHELDHPGWRTFGRLLCKQPALGSVLFLAVCGALSYGLVYFRTETKVIRYFPESARIVKDYWRIEQQLAGIVPIELIVRFDQRSQDETNFLDRQELVRAIEERLRQHEEISGCLSLADFLPQSERPTGTGLALTKYHKRATEALKRIRKGEFQGTKSFYNHLPPREIAAVDESASTPAAALSQPGDELWRITAQVNLMNDSDYSLITADFDRIAAEVLKMQPGASHLVTGTVPLFLRTQQAVLESLISSFALAFALILGVFVLLLRSVTAGLIAMIPNIIPITVVFGLISWMGQRVDIGTMITASIALGIAVDGTLHYLTWVKLGLLEGKDRNTAIVDALVHCGPAMWQTSFAIAAGLLVMVPAELLLISRFGSLMSMMIGVALVGDIMLMPLLLASPLGRLFVPKRVRIAGQLQVVSATDEGEAEAAAAESFLFSPTMQLDSTDGETRRATGS